MSYILDALRRADAERERGHVPGIHAQPTRMTPPTSAVARPADKARLWYAAALPLLLLLGWLTWRVASSDLSAPVAGSGAATPASALPTLQATVPEATVPPATVPPTTVPQATVPSATVSTAPPVAPLLTTAGESPDAQTRGAPTDRAAARVGPEGGTRAQTTPAIAGRSLSTSASAVSRRAVAAASVASGASAPAKVYALDELPDDIRRALPQLAIGGSIYSASAASRFVIVNGQLCHEGDTLAPGLVLQQIKLKSAVLAFRGYRYTIGL